MFTTAVRLASTALHQNRVRPHFKLSKSFDFLDGKKAGEIDAYIVERTNDTNMWHIYGLKPGAHTLNIVTRGDANPRSKGKRVAIAWAVIYD
ncbi:MAG: hypothetical protein M3R15_22590 [Acidobacteriota bacterium]|nr:hypothetical protein [Acidobacteriota bacterium]